MNKILKMAGIPENRFWGTATIFYPISLVLLILWWGNFNRKEKIKFMSIVVAWALIYLLNILPVIGQVASIVMLVFVVIAVVKYYQGEVDYKIILADNIATALVK
jgi:uncharacterized Tic20 family protein